jgi:DNA processing protein
MLYVKGRAELLSRRSLAVVGARNASAQGALNAERMAQALSEAGLTIVSGLALGIDAARPCGRPERRAARWP